MNTNTESERPRSSAAPKATREGAANSTRNTAWDTWKKGFDAWEARTAEFLETVMKTEAFLGPVGHMLTATMKTKKLMDDTLAKSWAMWGLPTRRDQERTLHALNQLQGRLTDLEDRLDELRKA